MNQFLSAFSSGTARGAIFALISLGMVLVWRGAGVINFAQIGQAMFTTYIASELISNKVSYWIAFLVAILSGAILGALIDLGVMRPLSSRKNSHLLNNEAMRNTIPIIASLGILGILKALAGIIWAGEERGFPTPLSNNGLKVGATTIALTPFDLFVIAVVFIALLLTILLFTKSGIGLAMRASALNPEVTQLSGIKIKWVRTLSWSISGAASSLAGLLITPSSNLSPSSLDLLLIIGFVAAVVGGLNSLIGAVIGGFIIGYLIAIVNVYGSPTNVFIALLAFLLLALFIRPQGLFGKKLVRRV